MNGKHLRERSEGFCSSEEQGAMEYTIARMVIYKQIAEFFSYPNIDLLSFFENSEIEKNIRYYRHFGIEPDEKISAIISWIHERLNRQTALRELEIEYTRLFVNAYPGIPAPPYGSIYLETDGLVWGDTTVDVLNIYTEAGLRISDDFHDVPDHIAAELEFVWYLLREELKAKEEEDSERGLKMSSIQRQFLTGHLLKWAPSFLDKVIENTRSLFYQEVSVLAKEFIKMEKVRFNINGQVPSSRTL